MRNERNIAPILVAIPFIAGLALDWLAPAFPIDIFRFPLNILAMVLWLAITIELYRQRGRWAISHIMLSPGATTLSLATIAALGILFGIERTPSTTAYTTIIALIFVMTHLALITLRGWRNNRGIRWRFVVNHLGLLIAIGAAFWGAPDREELRAVITRERPTTEAYDMDGNLRVLDHAIELRDFEVEYYDDGTPLRYEAKILIDNEIATIRVNKPYNATLAEAVYLISYDTASADECRYCIVEIVREPWRYATTAGIALMLVGAVMMFVGRATRKKS